MSRGRTVRALAACATFAAAVGPAAAAERVLEYLYVEPSTGESSGGHVALRFDEHVYHFQYAEPGVLRLFRDDLDAFLHAYGTLGNRGIDASRVAVSDETHARLRGAFNARLVREDADFAVLAALRRDRELLDAMRTGGTIALPGAGLFAEPGTTGGAPVLRALARQIEDAHGGGFLAARRAEIARARAALRYRPNPAAARAVPAGGSAPLHYGLGDRFVDLALEEIALGVLAEARPLAPGMLATSSDDAFILDAHERDGARAQVQALEQAIPRLVASPRADRGRPLLIAMARLVAADASSRTGRLHVLDVAPAAPGARPGRPPAEVRTAMLDDATALLGAAKARVLGDRRFDDGRANALEVAAARWLAARRTADGEAAAAAPVPYPSLPAPAAGERVPRDPALALDLERARTDERRYARLLHERYGYHLVSRNCVSELFRTVDGALAAAGEPAEIASTEQLGGWIDPDGAGHFIPFVAARAVRRLWAVTQTATIPSYRHQRLRALRAEESPVLTYLRESNTLTSTIYRWGADRERFVFFTDDAVPPRPLFGAVNLLAGFGQTALGLALLPADRGRTLVGGLQGALFSLPELAFINVRKGTLAYAEAQDGRA